MTVQVYQNEELNDIVFQVEALDEWKQLAAELGMEHQTKFVERAESPIPYPHINHSMDIIFSTLCPRCVDFKAYDKTPIPLEVMKQIAFSVREKHFQKIEIWFDDKTPDPFAIGVSMDYYVYDRGYKQLKNADGNTVLFKSEAEGKDYAQTIGFDYYGTSITNTNKYLIARWADELRPIPELKQLAKERLLDTVGAELKVTLENTTQALKKLTDNITNYLSGDITISQLKGENRF